MRHTQQAKTAGRSTLGPLIRKYRRAHNIEQRVLAKALSLSPAQMSKLEAGIHEPKESTTLKILSILFPKMQAGLLRIEAELELNQKGAP
jgi:transcriptional regulator with XRE-family HTH domain